MPAIRPEGKRNADTTRENAFAGQVLVAGGMLRSFATVGKMTLNPETKYSCDAVRLFLLVPPYLISVDQYSGQVRPK